MDAESYLASLELFGIKLGLRNIRVLLEELGHPERRFDSVHIAGTNGKGSVTAIVDAALRGAGYRSGRYTSPHLIHLRERFVIDGAPATEERLSTAAEEIRTAIDRLRSRGALEVQPTYFEATTAIAFQLFACAGVDVAVCEVGLGGRLDATNVLEPLATAITSIAFDHQQHLGATLREIAREKAGIIKPNTPVVVGTVSEEAMEEIVKAANERGAKVIDAWAGTSVEGGIGSSRRVKLATPVRDYGEIELGLRGAHQIGNAVVAVRLLEMLDMGSVPVPTEAIVAGVAGVRWPGRLDVRRFPDGREALLDAAHNPDGAAALAAYLRAIGGSRRPIVFASARDKDFDGMLAALAGVAGAFVFTRSSSTRSADPGELARRAEIHAPRVPVAIESSPGGAMATAWKIAPEIVVAGSIFLIGDVMKEFEWS